MAASTPRSTDELGGLDGALVRVADERRRVPTPHVGAGGRAPPRLLGHGPPHRRRPLGPPSRSVGPAPLVDPSRPREVRRPLVCSCRAATPTPAPSRSLTKRCSGPGIVWPAGCSATPRRSGCAAISRTPPRRGIAGGQQPADLWRGARLDRAAELTDSGDLQLEPDRPAVHRRRARGSTGRARRAGAITTPQAADRRRRHGRGALLAGVAVRLLRAGPQGVGPRHTTSGPERRARPRRPGRRRSDWRTPRSDSPSPPKLFEPQTLHSRKRWRRCSRPADCFAGRHGQQIGEPLAGPHGRGERGGVQPRRHTPRLRQHRRARCGCGTRPPASHVGEPLQGHTHRRVRRGVQPRRHPARLRRLRRDGAAVGPGHRRAARRTPRKATPAA